MQAFRFLTVLGHFVRHYLLLLVLLTVLGTAVVSVLLNGMGPVPQLPPVGFTVERGMVVLQWNRGTIEAPIRLQVSRTKDFDKPLLDQTVSGNTYNYQLELTRGYKYYWRVIQNDYESAVSSFVVSPYHVKL